jgi:hypothetical protein
MLDGGSTAVGSSGGLLGVASAADVEVLEALLLDNRELFKSSGKSGTNVGVGMPPPPPKPPPSNVDSPNGISGNKVGLDIDPTAVPVVVVAFAVALGHHHPLPMPGQPPIGVHGLMGGLKYDDRIFQMSQWTASGTRFV